MALVALGFAGLPQAMVVAGVPRKPALYLGECHPFLYCSESAL